MRAIRDIIRYLELPGESGLSHEPDEPLGRIVLVPLDRIAIIRWELRALCLMMTKHKK